MPRINRIRIVNFSYNNDSRHIIDETFNFHGGENALLNLANGGGKSVLVQLFLQPVVPGVRIQGRNIAGFFRKAKLPAYVMIEWKLDGAGGYLLTGIGIAPAQAGGMEEARHRVRFFTFTSKYTGANAFDLARIGVVNRKGAVLDVLPLREARDLIAERERKDPFNVRCFAEDDGDRYGRYLAEFGIAQEEWRSVIARINDSEGGLEEIFHKCKTGGQLLNDWILTTVDKAMFRNRSELRRLEEMLANLVEEVVENERFILEKQLLDGFGATFRQQVEALGGLLRGLDEEKKTAGRLCALHVHLTHATGSLQGQCEANEQEIEACRAAVQRVQLEERSHAYWRREAESGEAFSRLQAAETTRSETETALREAELQRTIMQASGLAAEIGQKRSELSGIEESLAAAREEYDTGGRVRGLEYSLRLLYGETLESVATDLGRLGAEKTARENQYEQAGADLQTVDKEKGSLDAEKGRLEERRQNFDRQEEEVFRTLGIRLVRNLIGGLDAAGIRNTRAALEKARDDLKQEMERRENEKTAGAVRRQAIDGELFDQRAAYANEEAVIHGIDRDIDEFEQKEAEIKGILTRHGLDLKDRFDRDRLAAAFEQLVQKLEGRLEEAVRIRDDLAESLASLKGGRLHVPEELASVLAGLDAEYETGEAYLRGLPPENRQALLAANPVLPFAFIMTRPDLDRVAGSLQSVTMRRVIPFIAYEDLGKAVPGFGRLARAGDGITLACLYEGRVFDHEGLAGLMAELEQKRTRAAEQCVHLTAAHRAAVSERAVAAAFTYAADHRHGLGIRRNQSELKARDLETGISLLEEEKKNLQERRVELEREINELQVARQKAGADWKLFAGFIEREPAYQDCRQRLADVVESIARLENRKKHLSGSRENLRKEIDGINGQVWRRNQEQQYAQSRYSLYRNALPAEKVEGSAAELEERLRALKEKYSGEIKFLEERRTALARECLRKQKELDRLGLGEEDYTGAIYDEQTVETISGEIARLTSLLTKMRGEEKEAARQDGAAKSALATALDEVKRLGAQAPLPPEDIRGDFGERRRRARSRVDELEADNKKISQQIQGYDRARETIGQLIDPGRTEPDKGFIPERDITLQAAGLTRAFSQIKSGNHALAGRLRTEYNELRVGYREKNLNLDNIFKGLDPLWDKTGMEFDGFYYLYERMSVHADKLAELVALYEAQLDNLERNKKDMVQQSFMHGLRLYEEIQLISENSKVRLQGRSRPVQMLKIDLDLDNKDAALQRMKVYIEECIVKVREETRKEKRGDEVRKTVARLMASRELLDVFLGNPNIPVSVFKIELNMANSRLMRWEEAVQNSGGEKFVVFFSVLSALTTYTRARAMDVAGADADTDTRVLVMDNPFGPISSEHLLNPLFDIAKKHRTQLICLSDLKQNSIMKCFNLIYMLKVRSSAIGNHEYLKFEEIIRDEDGFHDDEKLEKAFFRAADVKQISLFDDLDTYQ